MSKKNFFLIQSDLENEQINIKKFISILDAK